MPVKKTTKVKTITPTPIKREQFPLSPINFILMGICGAMIVAGFLLMLGAPSAREFNPDIFSTRRIIVGPSIAFIGFVAMAFAIIYRPKKKTADEEENTQNRQ